MHLHSPSVSASGLKVRSPAIAKAVTSSGDVTNACVPGLPSFLAAKFLLYDVTMELASPAHVVGRYVNCKYAWFGAICTRE